jgi:hypothetical protein
MTQNQAEELVTAGILIAGCLAVTALCLWIGSGGKKK